MLNSTIADLLRKTAELVESLNIGCGDLVAINVWPIQTVTIQVTPDCLANVWKTIGEDKEVHRSKSGNGNVHLHFYDGDVRWSAIDEYLDRSALEPKMKFDATVERISA